MIGKIQRCLYVLIAICSLLSCEEIPESNIPNMPVSYTIYWGTPEGLKIQAPGSIVEVRRKQAATEYIGYSGLLVVHVSNSTSNEYAVFDLCCPYEADQNITVRQTENLEYECPKCKSRYLVIYGGGVPIKGPSKYGLKRYTAIANQDGVYCRN